jgi:hypothetical protein
MIRREEFSGLAPNSIRNVWGGDEPQICAPVCPKSVPFGLREKGCEAPVCLGAFVPIYWLCRIGEFF